MDNVHTERRSRKRRHKRPRSLSSSSDNLNRTVSTSSSHRHYSKRRRTQSQKRITSKEGTDSRRKSKKRSSTKRSRTRTARSRNVSEQTNSALDSEAVQRNSQRTFNSPVPSTSVAEVVPSTSARVSFFQANTSANMSSISSIAQTVPSNNPGQSGSSQSVNMKPKCKVDKIKSRSSHVEEHSETELQCSICSELFIKATMLNCIHTFCKYCIDMWKRNKEECPLCRTPITSECRITKFDLLIEKISGKTVESRKQRMETLKEREELEMNLSQQETQSTAQQRRLRTPSLETAVQLLGVVDDSSSEEMYYINDDENDEDDNNSVDSCDINVFTDANNEEEVLQYGYFTDTDEDINDDAVEEYYNNGSEDSDVYVIDEENSSDGNESVNSNDNECNPDENVEYEISDENNENEDEEYEVNSEDNEEANDTGESNDNVDYETDNDNEETGNNYEENSGSHYSDDNIDDQDYNDNDEIDYYEENEDDDNSAGASVYDIDNNSNDDNENNYEYDSD